MHKQVLGALALLLIALTLPGEASALVQRTFVSKFGLDTNPCSATEPCRTFAAAIAQTQAGGEVLALDTAGYGPVTITKAISLISPPGVYAGITTTVPNADAITVSAGPDDVVVLKGLSVTGLGLGSDGVAFTSGRQLRVEGTTISGFLDNGIAFEPAVTARLTVTDSLIRDNLDAGIFAGVAAAPTEFARVTIHGTKLLGNSFNLYASLNSRVSMRDSVVSASGGYGVWAASLSAVVSVEACLISENQVAGIRSDGLVRVSGTTITGNGAGVAPVDPGTIFSRLNNTVEANETNGVFSTSFAAK